MTLKEKAYNTIRQRIINQELPPGSPLVETDLAKELGMSRTPIREAIRKLEQEGLVINISSRATIVSQINPHDVKEIFEVRIALETLALQKSFSSITKEAIDEVRQAYEALDEDYSYEQAFEIDLHLHNLWVRNSGNQRLSNILDSLNSQTERYRRYSHQVKQRSDASIKEHLAILDYIEAGDLPGAETALKTHLSNTQRNIQVDAANHPIA